MDKKFHDLLVRYVNGDCTAEEIQKVNRWYEEIADNAIQLEAGEKGTTKARMLSNIRKSLARRDHAVGRHRYLFTHTLVKVAAAVVVLVICGLWLFTGADSLPDNQLPEIGRLSGVVIFENEADSSRVYALPDGSTVQLGSLSRIHFTRNFSGGKREVYLTGKGFFNVVKDPARPFYVYSGKIATRVLGTSFFVDAPENARKLEVQVITGKVSVFQVTRDGSSSRKEETSMAKNSTANGVVLSPNQKVEYYTDDDHWVTGLVEDPVPLKSAEEETLSFVYENTPVKTVWVDIHSRFGIEVVTENEKICQCTFTGDVSRMTLYDMLEVISNSIGSSYEVKGTRILISGKGCN